MATTKIWAIKDSLLRVLNYAANPEKTEYTSLKNSLHYLMDEEKTALPEEKAFAVSAVNCSVDNAFEEMITIQERFGKTRGNVAYHAYQSFKTGEVSARQCHRIGVELAEKMWGDEYQVLVATHYNTGTYHNHFVVNAVNMWTGKKFNCNMAAYYRFRDYSDELCEKYRLTVIREPGGKTPRSIYFAEKSGAPTKYNLMRQAIDEAVKVSTNMNDFFKAMRLQGYYVDFDVRLKYATIRSIHSKKNTRIYRLGEGYSRPAIRERVLANRYRSMPERTKEREKFYASFLLPIKKHYKLAGSFSSLKPRSSLLAVYYHYLFLLGAFNRPPEYQPLSPEMREACRRVEMYSKQIRLISRQKLSSLPEVEKFIEKTETEMDTVKKARNQIYNQLRRRTDEEQMRILKKRRDDKTQVLKLLREDLKTARSILTEYPQIKDNMLAENKRKCELIEQTQLLSRQRTRYRSYGYPHER